MQIVLNSNCFLGCASRRNHSKIKFKLYKLFYDYQYYTAKTSEMAQNPAERVERLCKCVPKGRDARSAHNTVQAKRSAVVEKQPNNCVPKGRDFEVSAVCGYSSIVFEHEFESFARRKRG